jgi:hypothetical protein
MRVSTLGEGGGEEGAVLCSPRKKEKEENKYIASLSGTDDD